MKHRNRELLSTKSFVDWEIVLILYHLFHVTEYIVQWIFSHEKHSPSGHIEEGTIILHLRQIAVWLHLLKIKLNSVIVILFNVNTFFLGKLGLS